MKELTFKFDCQLNDDEDYVKAGTKVKLIETGKQHEGFAKVLITKGYGYNGEPIQFVPFTDHFLKSSFVELS